MRVGNSDHRQHIVHRKRMNPAERGRNTKTGKGFIKMGPETKEEAQYNLRRCLDNAQTDTGEVKP